MNDKILSPICRLCYMQCKSMRFPSQCRKVGEEDRSLSDPGKILPILALCTSLNDRRRKFADHTLSVEPLSHYCGSTLENLSSCRDLL